MVSNRDMKDVRSTGRRRARKVLFESYADYKCFDCGVTTKEPPKDAPRWFEDIWPTERRELNTQLQADHETKDLTVNDESFVNWRCPSCHKKQDLKTEKGEATVKTSGLW